jgi:hypothetical protein
MGLAVGDVNSEKGRLRAGEGRVRTASAGPLQESRAGGLPSAGAEWTASMTIRKLAAYAPLAVLVGSLVHLAAAGVEHAPGGRNALPLLVGLGAALALCLAASFCDGALGSFRRSVTTRGQAVSGTLALALAGIGAYALIELLEGHAGAGGALRALAAALPAAGLVLALARRATRAAAGAGSRLAGALASVPTCGAGARRLPASRRRTLVRRRRDAGVRSGRAPPIPA